MHLSTDSPYATAFARYDSSGLTNVLSLNYLQAKYTQLLFLPISMSAEYVPTGSESAGAVCTALCCTRVILRS